MTPDELGPIVLAALTTVAPEIDPTSIETGVSLRDQLDIDSMDFLNFVTTLHDRLGVNIPETDYPHLATLDSAIAYLAAKLGP